MPMRARSNVITGLRSKNDADSVAVTIMGTATLSSDSTVSRLKEIISTLTSKKGMRMTIAENAREKCSSPAKESDTMKA